MQDGRQRKSFYGKIAVSILKTKLYLLTLYKYKKWHSNEDRYMVLKDNLLLFFCFSDILLCSYRPEVA